MASDPSTGASCRIRRRGLATLRTCAMCTADRRCPMTAIATSSWPVPTRSSSTLPRSTRDAPGSPSSMVGSWASPPPSAATDVVELDDLFVDPDWMRRGVGRQLVLDVEAVTRRGAAPGRGDGERPRARLLPRGRLRGGTAGPDAVRSRHEDAPRSRDVTTDPAFRRTRGSDELDRARCVDNGTTLLMKEKVMPKMVITHNVVDVDNWLQVQGGAGRRDRSSGRLNPVDHVAFDGSTSLPSAPTWMMRPR